MQPFSKNCQPRQIEVKVEWLLHPDPAELQRLEYLPKGQEMHVWDVQKCSRKDLVLCPPECWYISLADGKDPFLAEDW